MSLESSSSPPHSEVPGYQQDHPQQQEKDQERPSQNQEDHLFKHQHQRDQQTKPHQPEHHQHLHYHEDQHERQHPDRHRHPHEHEKQRPQQHENEEQRSQQHQHEEEEKYPNQHQQQSSNQFQLKHQHDAYGAGKEEQKHQQQAQQQLTTQHQDQYEVTTQNQQQLSLQYPHPQHPIHAQYTQQPTHQYHNHPHHVHYSHQHPHHTPLQHQRQPCPECQQHMKGDLTPFYPGAVASTFPTLTNQMQLSSHSVHVYTSDPSPANLQVSYPLPLATHGEVVINKELFFSTLTKLHATLGTKLSIPRIGGRDLDLHLLYKEVTAHGGHDRITLLRKWKAITSIFDFPPTTTSASHVLKKHYSHLLLHYEQVYFQNMGAGVLSEGPVIPLSVPRHPVYPISCVPPAIEYIQSPLEVPAYVQKQKIDSGKAFGVDPASLIGSVVTGFIEGKFEHGYLANVKVRGETMACVLYHPPPSSTIPQGATVSAFEKEYKTTIMEHQTECSRKKKISRKDPKAPRQNKTAYNFFFAEQRARLKSTQPDKDRAISKMIGKKWNQLSENEKLPYRELGRKEKERYKREMFEYRETQRLGTESIVIQTKDSPNGSRHTGTKDEHKCDIDVNKVSSMDTKQEAIPYEEHNVQLLSESISISTKAEVENQGL